MAGLSAIVGVADAVRALFWMGLEAAAGSVAPPLDLVRQGALLLAWCLVAIAAYQGWRRNSIPPTWLLASIVGCAWVLIIIQRIGG